MSRRPDPGLTLILIYCLAAAAGLIIIWITHGK